MLVILTPEMSYRIKVRQGWGEGTAWRTPVCRKVETDYFRIFKNFVGLNHFAGFSHQLLSFQAIHSEDLSRLRPLRPSLSRGRSNVVKVVVDVGHGKKVEKCCFEYNSRMRRISSLPLFCLEVAHKWRHTTLDNFWPPSLVIMLFSNKVYILFSQNPWPPSSRFVSLNPWHTLYVLKVKVYSMMDGSGIQTLVILNQRFPTWGTHTPRGTSKISRGTPVQE